MSVASRLLLTLVLLFPIAAHGANVPPRKPLSATAVRRLNAAMKEYSIKEKTIRPLSYTLDDYFCRGTSGLTKESSTFELDAQGLPMKKHDSGNYYHPISLARSVIDTSLTYGITRRPEIYVWMVTGADKLVEIMDKGGAYRYPHAYNLYYHGVLKPGWTSAMAQGTVLSAFARAYHLTCNPRYLEAGNRTLEHLLLPMEKGGTASDLRFLDPSLAGYAWYEEYPNPDKPAYTLNGYMYTLIGLYDWAFATGSEEAMRAFQAGIRSLLVVLPLFDYDGFSMYDLAPMVYGTVHVFNPHYHGVHMMQLSTLYAITREPKIEEYRARWYAKVGGPVATCGKP